MMIPTLVMWGPPCLGWSLSKNLRSWVEQAKALRFINAAAKQFFNQPPNNQQKATLQSQEEEELRLSREEAAKFREDALKEPVEQVTYANTFLTL